MMRRTILLICFMMMSTMLMAQSISVRSFSLSPNDLEAKMNPVYDANGNPAALIRISSDSENLIFSGDIVNVPFYKNGEWLLYMTDGARSLKISTDSKHSLNYDFPNALQASHSYEMSIVVHDGVDVKMLFMPSAAFGGYNQSYGLMTGAMFNDWGAYLRARSNFSKTPSCAYICDEYGTLEDGNKGWFSGASEESRLSLTAGAMRSISSHLNVYAGAGYGSRTLAWECYDGQYAKVSTRSFRGIETEAGIILTLGPVSFSIGADLCGFKALEGVVGIGLMF